MKHDTGAVLSAPRPVELDPAEARRDDVRLTSSSRRAALAYLAGMSSMIAPR
jgi:hypothetical protein